MLPSQLNAYMDGSVGGAARGLFAMPKQPARAAAVAPGTMVGISSFAFQGTNAHALLAALAGSTEGGPAGKPVAWQRNHISVLPPAHVQLRAFSLSSTSRAAFEMTLGQPVHAFFADHIVSGKVVFPGAGYLEMAVATGTTLLQGSTNRIALVGTAIAAPLILPHPIDNLEKFTMVVLRAEVDATSGTCQLVSRGGVHVSTHLSLLGGAAQAHQAIEAAAAVVATERLVAGCTEPLAAIYVYRRLAEAGLQYGSAFRLLRDVKQGGSTAVACMRPSSAWWPTEFIMNPAVLDCCLQLGGMVPSEQGSSKNSSSGPTYIPAGLEALHAGGSIGAQPVVALARRPAGVIDTEAAVLRRHAMVDSARGLVCQVEGLESRSIGSKNRSGATTQQQDMLYEINWLAAEVTTAAHNCCLTGTTSGQGHAALNLGAPTIVSASAAGLLAVQGALAAGAGCISLTSTGQHVSHTSTSGITPSASQALWAMLRTAAQECSGQLAVSGMDIDCLDPSACTADQLLVEASSVGASAQAFDGYGTSRSGRTLNLPAMAASEAHSAPAPFQLLPMPRGSLASLAPQVMDAAGVAPGQILLAVKAVGINFR